MGLSKMKECRKCNVEFEANADNFYRQKDAADGWYPWCKSCKRINRRKYKEQESHQARTRWIEDEEWRQSRIASAKHWRDNNREYIRKYEKQRRELLPEEHGKVRRAGYAVQQAIKSGLMTRPTTCSWCSEKHPQIEGAHHDYDLPLDIIWLCKPCHMQWDYEYPKAFGDIKFDMMEYFYGEETNRGVIPQNKEGEDDTDE